MTIRLVVADDHPIILNSLAALLSQEPEFEVPACCRDGREAFEAVRRQQPDVAILDSRMEGMSGLEVVRQVRVAKLPTRLVLFTAGLESEYSSLGE
jgi:DNA-binding NarL/FixJ family response regulator